MCTGGATLYLRGGGELPAEHRSFEICHLLWLGSSFTHSSGVILDEWAEFTNTCLGETRAFGVLNVPSFEDGGSQTGTQDPFGGVTDDSHSLRRCPERVIGILLLS